MTCHNRGNPKTGEKTRVNKGKRHKSIKKNCISVYFTTNSIFVVLLAIAICFSKGKFLFISTTQKLVLPVSLKLFLK